MHGDKLVVMSTCVLLVLGFTRPKNTNERGHTKKYFQLTLEAKITSIMCRKPAAKSKKQPISECKFDPNPCQTESTMPDNINMTRLFPAIASTAEDFL